MTAAAHNANVRLTARGAVHAGYLSTDSTPGEPRYAASCAAGHRTAPDGQFIVPTAAPVLDPITCRHCLNRQHGRPEITAPASAPAAPAPAVAVQWTDETATAFVSALSSRDRSRIAEAITRIEGAERETELLEEIRETFGDDLPNVAGVIFYPYPYESGHAFNETATVYYRDGRAPQELNFPGNVGWLLTDQYRVVGEYAGLAVNPITGETEFSESSAEEDLLLWVFANSGMSRKAQVLAEIRRALAGLSEVDMITFAPDEVDPQRWRFTGYGLVSFTSGRAAHMVEFGSFVWRRLSARYGDVAQSARLTVAPASGEFVYTA